MEAKEKYESLILNEVKGIPEEALPMVIKILHSLWDDERSADDIINDIRSCWTGFGRREIKLH